ncbi:n-alpha-acetyltransferase 50 [Trichonephila clavata]|uniref:N-alpha-acetyltransferase 50 n=1 Tax=Trichonephila clavata TaxID=2740835 RepID=A0A8X6EZY5_TRICU|nr:n-alpha-acetyltransferase 50 [Trichonephila clavata]
MIEEYSTEVTNSHSKKSGKIELGDVTPHNIRQLKRLNQVVFPVSYNDKFYKDILVAGELAKLAYYNDIVVGAYLKVTSNFKMESRKLFLTNCQHLIVKFEM